MDDPEIAQILQNLHSHQAPEAWAEFLRSFSPLILQVVRMTERDADHVADCYLFVCEQLSLRQFRRLGRFQPNGPASVPTWLRAVVRNLCLDWRRREFGRHRVFESLQRLQGHLAECDYCLSQIAALVRLEGVSMPENVPPALLARAIELGKTPPSVSAWPAVRWGAVAAATACLAIFATVWMHRPETSPLPSPVPVTRPSEIPTAAPRVVAAPAPTPREVRNGKVAGPSLRLLAPREGSVLARQESDIRWTEVPGSLYSEVRVMTADGDLVWEGRAEGNQTRLPANIPLVPGAKYFVSVRVVLTEGKTVTSPVVGFTTRNNE